MTSQATSNMYPLRKSLKLYILHLKMSMPEQGLELGSPQYKPAALPTELRSDPGEKCYICNLINDKTMTMTGPV